MSTIAATRTWFPVCAFEHLVRERGVAAYVAGRQVAIFRMYDDEIFAVGNCDPFTNAYVLSRGIVGTRGDTPTVASPLLKHAFDLRTGLSLDDSSKRLPVYSVRVVDGTVEVLCP
jgi:nitrite reductase (NADH) small subunit